MEPTIKYRIGKDPFDTQLILTTADGLEIDLFQCLSVSAATVIKANVDEMPELHLTIFNPIVECVDVNVDPEILEAAARAIRERRERDEDSC